MKEPVCRLRARSTPVVRAILAVSILCASQSITAQSGNAGMFLPERVCVLLSMIGAAQPDGCNPNDPSALTGPVFGELPEDLEEANYGAFDGGVTGSPADA